MKINTSFFFVLFAAMLWGTTGTSQPFAPVDTHPIAFGTMRMAIGGSILLIIVLIQKQISFRNWPVPYVVLAAFFMASYQPLFFSAVKLTGVAIGSVVTIGSAPIVAGIVESIVQKKKPLRKWWIATICAISGCCFLIVNKSSITIDPLGIILALGAGTAFASNSIIAKKLLEYQKPEAVVAITSVLSACFLSPFLLFLDLSWILERNGYLSILYISIFATALAYVMYTKGLSKLPTSTAVTLTLAEPMTAALLGVFFIGEQLTLYSWIGIGMLFVSIVILTYEKGQKGKLKHNTLDIDK